MGKSSKPTIPDESMKIIRRGQAALKRLDSDKNWLDWLEVGEAVVELRTVALTRAGTNAPYGPAYTRAYADLWSEFKFAERIKDKADRQKLVAVMDHLPEIQTWRHELSVDDRRRWNHPTTVYREWQKAKKATLPEDNIWKRPPPSAVIEAQKAEIKELQQTAARPWLPGSTAAEKARAIVGNMSLDEAEQFLVAFECYVKELRAGTIVLNEVNEA